MSNNGGSAFPAQPIYRTPSGDEICCNQSGMTLRDYFAAKAMQSLLDLNGNSMGWTKEIVGKQAYMMADAMLAARELLIEALQEARS